MWSTTLHMLSWNEQNSLKYADKYVVNNLTKQYRKMVTEKASQFAEFLESMVDIQNDQ